jgi:hypothetical protein
MVRKKVVGVRRPEMRLKVMLTVVAVVLLTTGIAVRDCETALTAH